MQELISLFVNMLIKCTPNSSQKIGRLELGFTVGAYILIAFFVGLIFKDSLNTDAIAYLRLAQYWVEGKYHLAISGYWSPLLTWFIAFGIATGLSPLASARCAMVISGLVFMGGALWCYRYFLPVGFFRFLISFLTGVVTAVWSALELTPDLLVSGIMLIVFNLWTVPMKKVGIYNFLSGVIWGIGYLAKAIGLPVGIIWLTVSLILTKLYIRVSSFLVIRTVSLIAFGFICISGPWIAALSTKYGNLTISTAANAAHAVMAPGWPTPLHPFGFTLHEVEDGRLTMWEDPTKLVYPNWSPFKDSESFKHQLKICLSNLIVIMANLAQMDRLAIGLFSFFALLIMLIYKPKEIELYLCMCVIGWILVLLPVYADEIRYIYILWPLLLIISYKSLSLWSVRVSKPFKNFLLSLVVCSFSLGLSKQLHNLFKSTAPLAGKISQAIAVYINSIGSFHGRVAGSGWYKGHRLGLYVSYFLDTQWVGDEEGLSNEKLHRLNVEMVFLHPARNEVDMLLSGTNFVPLLKPGMPIGDNIICPIWVFRRYHSIN